MLFVFLIGRKRSVKEMLRALDFWLLSMGTLVFLILCFAIEPIGLLFNVSENPFGYAVLSLIPAIVFASVYFILEGRRAKGKS
jgi:hypothetical protein